MSNDNKVRNIYYMLCYVFFGERLTQIDEQKYSTEKYENIYDFYTLIFCILLDKVIKKGTYKTYVPYTDEINKIKGKIEFTESIKKLSFIKCKPICSYDEFSNNNLINRVILTTINRLIKTRKLGKSFKPKLNRYKAFYCDVDEILDIKTIKWNTIKYDRNNKEYSYIIYLCKMILNEVIADSYKGNTPFKNYSDLQDPEDLFESFLRKYIGKNYPQFKVIGETLEYSKEKKYMFMPTMRTDISVIDKKNNRAFIIDAKFYKEILTPSKANYYNPNETRLIYNRDHLFQINTYVQNYKVIKGYKDVHGLLLYAQTPDNPVQDSDYMKINDNSIAIKTVDMTSSWKEIEEKIHSILDDFVNDTFKEI